MSRYIDADKLKHHLQNCIDECKNTGQDDSDYITILNALGNQPTADVQEVKHARWIPLSKSAMNIWGHTLYRCSNCNDGVCFDAEKILLEKYCRSCGAKMDGDKNN